MILRQRKKKNLILLHYSKYFSNERRNLKRPYIKTRKKILLEVLNNHHQKSFTIKEIKNRRRNTVVWCTTDKKQTGRINNNSIPAKTETENTGGNTLKRVSTEYLVTEPKDSTTNTRKYVNRITNQELVQQK